MALLVALVVASSAVGQDSTDARFYENDPRFGLTRNSKFYNEIASRREIDNRDNLIFRPVFAKIIGDEGVPFENNDTKIIIPSILNKAIESKSEELATLVTKKVMDVQFLPNCSESIKVRTKVNIAEEKVPKGTLVSDILYLRKTEIPKDPVEVFGPSVEIRSYEPDPKNIHYRGAQGLGVTCLPYRIRITDSYTDRLVGKAALRNYTRNVTGNGFLHKEAKQLMH